MSFCPDCEASKVETERTKNINRLALEGVKISYRAKLEEIGTILGGDPDVDIAEVARLRMIDLETQILLCGKVQAEAKIATEKLVVFQNQLQIVIKRVMEGDEEEFPSIINSLREQFNSGISR
jgi:hypothetical protein